jgi:antitoxin HigA-1
MPMKNPPHPGRLALHQCIEPLGLTITDAAAALGVTRTTLPELVNGKRGIPRKWLCACLRSSEAVRKAG